MCSAQGPAKCSVTEARKAAVYGRGMGGRAGGRGQGAGPEERSAGLVCHSSSAHVVFKV